MNNNKRATKRALLTSVMALVMCVVMLVGTTFAWFTDTASTAVNKIVAGNLDVDIVDENGDSLDGKSLSFKNVNDETDILWEPGATFNLDSFKIVNKGNLAFKYKVIISGVNGNAKLLEAIDFFVKIGDAEKVALADWEGILLPEGEAATDTMDAGITSAITISGTMKKEAGNEYQGLSIDGIGITVVATQYTYENDSYGNTYDEKADATIQVNKDNIQDYLDGKYGSIDGMTLVLAAGDYGQLELGRATKYAGSNTQYRNDSFDSETISLEELKSNNGANYYTRRMNNVTFKPAEGATVTIAGIEMLSGHSNDDHVLDTARGCFIAQKVYNIAFEHITFSDWCNIGTSSAATVIDGFRFNDCTFNITDAHGGLGSQGICVRDENGDAVVKNIFAEKCTFNNCYQGIYTKNVRDITVNECTFNTTTHNAIAIQDSKEFNHGAVVITDNKFNKIGAEVIRFGHPGADTQITIKDNTAANIASGRNAIKAEGLVDGITYDISGNTWNGAGVSHEQFNDKVINP